MAKHTIELTPEQEKALLTDMVSIDEFIRNALLTRANRYINLICEKALKDETGEILAEIDKANIENQIAALGKVIYGMEDLPDNIKTEIVQKASIKSAAERNEEIT